MICPKCGSAFVGAWQDLFTRTDSVGQALKAGETSEIPDQTDPEDDEISISANWMECPARRCRTTIFRIVRRAFGDVDAFDEADEFDATGRLTEEWVVWPRGTGRAVDPLIPAEFANAYREATLILDDSPSMSSVVARGLVADLLKANGYASDRLEKQVDAFMNDPAIPARLRKLVDPIRILGDFGAHSLRDAEGNRVVVSRADAEWTLTVLDRLFHHFIIEPAHDDEALQRATELTQRVPNRRPPKAPPR